MNKAELEAFAREAAKTIKTEKDLNAFSQMLTKITVEAALNAELDDHLGYGKHQQSDTAKRQKLNATANAFGCPDSSSVRHDAQLPSGTLHITAAQMT